MTRVRGNALVSPCGDRRLIKPPGSARSRGSAANSRWEGLGSLAPGNHADLRVVDRNPLECPVEDLPGTEVRATMLGGELVHGEL
jgi:predicted amidohydrolase YtcJ